MAQLVVAAAGAALGGFIAPGIVAFGMTGASLGWMAGSMIGSAFAPTQKSSGPQLSDLSVSTSAYGTPIPYVQGHPRISGQIVWASAKREIAATTEQGKGGGGAEYTSYTYEVDLLILLTDNEIDAVPRIWSNGELVYTALIGADEESLVASQELALWSRITIYTGASNQLPDPDYEVAVGAANAPAYRGRGSIFIKSLQLGGGGQIPNLTFEVAVNAVPAGAKTRLQTSFSDGTSNDISAYKIGPGVNSDGTVSEGMYSILSNRVAFKGLTWTDPGLARVAGTPLTFEFFCRFSEITNNASQRINIASLSSQLGLLQFYLSGSVSGGPNRLAYVDWQGSGNSYIDTVDAYGPKHHFAVVFRDDGVFSVYIKGVRVIQDRAGGSGTSASLSLGGTGSGNGQSTGMEFSGVRVRRDVVYTGAIFVPPEEFPLPDGAAFSQFDSSLQEVAQSLCLKSGLSAAQFDVTPLAAITRPVRSMAISSVSSARTVLDMLASSYHFEAVLSDKIYFRPRASAPAATLTFNELGVVVDSGSTPDPLPLTQANELEIPAQMALTYSNVDGDYQTDTQYSDRLLTGQESTSAMQVPLGFTSSEAKQIVDAMLLDKAVSALTTSVSMGLTRAALEPTDVVLLTGEDGSSYRMRIVKKAEASGVTTLECVQDDATVFVQTGVTSGGTVPQTTVSATVATELEVLDIPLLRDVDNVPGHYVAVKGNAAGWQSAALFASTDGTTYAQNTSVNSQAVMGACTSTLANYTGTGIDTSTLTVSVGLGQLSSVTEAAMLASESVNLAVVGSELVQFQTATLVSAGVYTLTNFRRGARGTEWARAGHAISERFVLLTNAGVRFVALQSSDIGTTRYYKGVSAGQKLSDVTAKTLAFQSINLKPFAPVGVAASFAADGLATFTWTRRTRLSTVGTTGALPLGEASESYEIDVAVAGVVKSTIKATSPSAVYLSQYTDLAGAAPTVTVTVYQMSATVGRGYGSTPLTVALQTVPVSSVSTTTGTSVSASTGGELAILPVCYAGSKVIASKTKAVGSSVVHTTYESADGGATFSALTGASVFLGTQAVGRADGVYISIVSEESVGNLSGGTLSRFSIGPGWSIMRGVAGALPAYVAFQFPVANRPTVCGTDGTKFVVICEGNAVYTSADGIAWTLAGTAAGFPVTFIGGAYRNYAVSELVWSSGRWLLGINGIVYYTTDANAQTGWTAATMPAYSQFIYALAADGAGVLVCYSTPWVGTPGNERIDRSTDNGSTWTTVWNKPAGTAITNYSVLKLLRLGGEFVGIFNQQFNPCWTLKSTGNGASWSVVQSNLTVTAFPWPVSTGTKLVVVNEDADFKTKHSTDGVTFSNSTGITL